MQRRNVLILLFVAGLVALVFAWQHFGGGEPTPGGGTGGPEPPVVPLPQGSQDPPPPVPADTLRVRIEVHAEETFVPPSPPRVLVRSAVGGELPAAIVAGAGAGFDAVPAAAGAALVAIDDGPRRLLRQTALVAGERATIALGARRMVRGRVSGADRAAIAGARVWFGETHDGQRHEFETDVEGNYEAEVTAGNGVPFAVRAEGFATQWRAVDVADVPLPCDLELARGTTLEVQLAGVAVAMEQGRVFVVPASSVGGGVAAWPFFEQAVDDGVPLAANGHAVLFGLPAQGEVVIVVRHPRAPLSWSSPVVLKPERSRTLVPIAFDAATVAGRVVDEQGQPLAGVTVVGRSGTAPLQPGTSQRFVSPHLQERGQFWSRTGADGTFVVGVPDGRNGRLSLRAPARAGRELPLSAAGDVPIVLPSWLGGEPQLVVKAPRPGVAWLAETDLGGGAHEMVAADQAFRISLPHAGRFHVVLTTRRGEASATARHDGVVATGSIELTAPRLP